MISIHEDCEHFHPVQHKFSDIIAKLKESCQGTDDQVRTKLSVVE